MSVLGKIVFLPCLLGLAVPTLASEPSSVVVGDTTYILAPIGRTEVLKPGEVYRVGEITKVERFGWYMLKVRTSWSQTVVATSQGVRTTGSGASTQVRQDTTSIIATFGVVSMMLSIFFCFLGRKTKRFDVVVFATAFLALACAPAVGLAVVAAAAAALVTLGTEDKRKLGYLFGAVYIALMTYAVIVH